MVVTVLVDEPLMPGRPSNLNKNVQPTRGGPGFVGFVVFVGQGPLFSLAVGAHGEVQPV